MTIPAAPLSSGGDSSLCWNCNQPLRAGSERCLWCGVSQVQAQPAQFVVAPTSVEADAAAADPQAVPQLRVRPAGAPKPARSRAQRVGATLDPSFSGSAARPAPQVVAFTIDVLVVLAVAATVFLVSQSIVFAMLAIVELVIGLWVVEARTGATFGKAIMRIRTSRDDSPYSPGIGRAFVRRLLEGLGFLAGGAGAWAVAASGSFDKSGLSRSWADRAARTQIVSVPPRVRTSKPASRAVVAPVPAGLTGYTEAQSPVVLAAPQVISTLARPHSVDENSASQSQTAAPTPAFADVKSIAPAQVESPTRGDQASVGVPESVDGTILLVFDTGQREQFTTPVAVNLGRNPTPNQPGDKLVTVTDPESTVSKTHARLEHSRGRTWITDGGSTNGTDLLGDDGDVTTLTPGNRVLLDEGTRVRIGNRAFTVSLILGGEK